MSQQEYFGFGSVENLEDILGYEKIERPFLVTGKNSFQSCGAKRKIYEIFERIGYKVVRFCDFSPNPQLGDLIKGRDLFDEKYCDGIIGVGGGSAIDVAKSIKTTNFLIKGINVPLIAIPTTAGSGSEATSFIVYYAGKGKKSKGDPLVTLPNYSICDPQFTLDLPREITASTGMDALSQAIESYWSIYSTDESKEFAEQSIKLSIENLVEAVKNPSANSRESMMKAANLAGKAINITKTTACHSISYPITSYFGVPHGHAVGLTLAEILLYNSSVTEKDCNDVRGVSYVQKTIKEIAQMFGVKNIVETYGRIKELMYSIGLEQQLSKLGIDGRGKEIIVRNGFKPERVKNNPRHLTEEDLREILWNIH